MVERILEILKAKNLSCNRVETDLKFGNGAIKKFDTSIPSVNKIRDLAVYLNVSVDYILGLSNSPSPASQPQKNEIPHAILSNWEHLRPNEIAAITALVETLTTNRSDN